MPRCALCQNPFLRRWLDLAGSKGDELRRRGDQKVAVGGDQVAAACRRAVTIEVNRVVGVERAVVRDSLFEAVDLSSHRPIHLIPHQHTTAKTARRPVGPIADYLSTIDIEPTYLLSAGDQVIPADAEQMDCLRK